MSWSISLILLGFALLFLCAKPINIVPIWEVKKNIRNLDLMMERNRGITKKKKKKKKERREVISTSTKY